MYVSISMRIRISIRIGIAGMTRIGPAEVPSGPRLPEPPGGLGFRSLFSFVSLSGFIFLSKHSLLFMFLFVAGLTSVWGSSCWAGRLSPGRSCPCSGAPRAEWRLAGGPIGRLSRLRLRSPIRVCLDKDRCWKFAQNLTGIVRCEQHTSERVVAEKF